MQSERLKELVQVIKDKQAELQKEAQKVFKAGCQEFFDSYPELKKFSWPQYSPYFNDGDECIFSVVTDLLRVNDYENYYDRSRELYIEPWVEKAEKELKSFLELIPDDVMQNMFGNHAEVTIYRDKEPDVDGYSHD